MYGLDAAVRAPPERPHPTRCDCLLRRRQTHAEALRELPKADPFARCFHDFDPSSTRDGAGVHRPGPGLGGTDQPDNCARGGVVSEGMIDDVESFGTLDADLVVIGVAL